ncbi:MAG: ABC transporter permease [Acidobacteriia bacterium]|nr:ABC transporter permease [Terriglobia bacterium]
MSERPHPLVELTRARILEFLREKEALFWVFVFPVLLACALGVAFRNRPVDLAHVAVAAGTSEAERLADQLRRAPGVTAFLLAPREAEEALRHGRVDVIVEDGGTARDGRPAVIYRFDATRPESLAARDAADEALQRAAGRSDPLETGERRVTEPGSRYVDYLIPGLVGLNLMGSGMWGIGFTVVAARTRKLLKRFAATPMRRSHYLLSFALSRLIFLSLEVAAVVGFGWLVFGVRVRGSLVDLALVAILGAATFAGIGLLVAARPRSIEAVSGWMNLVMLPMWLLSGTFFSYERFPAVLHPAIRALPLTALNDALRAVVNDGASLASRWSEALVMVAWGVVAFVLALRLFRWQ